MRSDEPLAPAAVFQRWFKDDPLLPMVPRVNTPCAWRGMLPAAVCCALLAAHTGAFAQGFPEEFSPPITSGNPTLPDDIGVAPDPASPVAGVRPLVVDVIIQGVKNEERVLNQIRTKREFEYDPVQLQADVRRLVTSGQYHHVKTYLRNVAEGVVVIFEIVERPKVNYIEFLGNRNFADRKLLKVANLKVGEPLNAYEVEEGRRKLEEHYHSKGFPKAHIGILEGDKPEDKGVAYVISEGLLQRISSVTFEGNTFASDGQLRSKIESKPGILWYFLRGKLDRSKLDSDVENITAYYRDFGYFRARVGRQLEFDEAGQWATIRFIIDEGPRYNVRNVSVVGNKLLRSDPLLSSLELKNNKPYNRAQMEKDRNLLQDLYGSQGYIFSVVQPEPRFLEEPGEIDLVYKIQEGEPFRVGQINVHIAGEFPHTRRNVVLNRLSLQPGDLIDIREIRNSERRLKASQLFETEATGGEPPRIVVRPPELQDSAIAGAGRGAFRGQSPDDATPALPGRQAATLPMPTYDVDVYLPRFRDEAAPATLGADVNGTRRLPPVD
jgi:outer membrane protein insertion porin family